MITFCVTLLTNLAVSMWLLTQALDTKNKQKKKEKTNNKKIAKVLELLLYANDIVFLKMKRNNRNG